MIKYKIGDNVEFTTIYGTKGKTGSISSIFENTIYVIPDGTTNSVPVKSIDRIISTRYTGLKPLKEEKTLTEYINGNLNNGLSIKQLIESYYLQYPESKKDQVYEGPRW